ncbi:primosomal protein N' family DNA-binding protein [Paludibacterium denitrificans]|uniref:primosomal protein N' family DNA-binding protein n=1 Tax=Paludibacterium denitrificans TaxID=2675226 RepID=UPI001E51EBB6|nr:hypothetical protein [Paludibacterium denitrificans]
MERTDAGQVQVAVDVPLFGTFSYLTSCAVEVGQRVCVPFGGRQLCGVVVNLASQPDLDPAKLRSLGRPLSGVPPLPADFLAMVQFAADYYHHPLGQTLFTALPTALRAPRDVVLPDNRGWALTPAGQQSRLNGPATCTVGTVAGLASGAVILDASAAGDATSQQAVGRMAG